jgi:hypothetical protein
MKMKSNILTAVRKVAVKGWKPALLATLLLGFAVVSTTVRAGGKGNPNPGVLPPQSNSHGQSYGEWGAAWWQWVLAQPQGDPSPLNPLNDPDGTYAGAGQAGPVWFLAGSWLNYGPPHYIAMPTVRTCVVPAGKTLFFPIVNTLWGVAGGDVGDVDQLLAGAAASIDLVEVLQVEVDWVPLENLWSYRAASPGGFSLPVVFGNVCDPPLSPNVCDGYWLMLAPLSHGFHTIHFHAEGGTYTDPTYRVLQDVTYHLTVR